MPAQYLARIAAAAVAAAAAALSGQEGRTSVSPAVVWLDRARPSLGKWPDFTEDPEAAAHTIRVTYVVGPGGLAAGGGIQVGLGHPTYNTVDNPRLTTNAGYIFVPQLTASRSSISMPQLDDPAAPDFTSASASSGVSLEVSLVTRAPGSSARLVQVRSLAASLREGESIEIVYGDRAGGSPGLLFNHEPNVLSVVTFVDETGDGSYDLDPTPPATLTITGRASAFLVHGPVTATSDAPTDLGLVAIDRAGRGKQEATLPALAFVGDVRLTCTDPLASYPAHVHFGPGDRGARRLAVTLRTGGVHTFTASLLGPRSTRPQRVVRSVSNAIVVLDASRRAPPEHGEHGEYRVLCGDLQRHKSTGGHAGIPGWQAFEEMWRLREDFGATVNHASTPFAGLQAARETVLGFRAAHDPGEERFVAFIAYESSYREGHRHVVFQDPDPPGMLAFLQLPYSGGEPPPVPEFVARLTSFLQRVALATPAQIAIPHHPAWRLSGSTEFVWGPTEIGGKRVQPAVEIFSTHGSSEAAYASADEIPAWEYPIHESFDDHRQPGENGSFQEALAADLARVGVVGGSDDHSPWRGQGLHGTGAPTGVYGRYGLTFVLIEPELPLRAGIWKALLARRTYATTGQRAFLHFGARIGAARWPMGAEIRASLDPLLEVRAVASSALGREDPARVERIDILRDGGELALSRTVDPPRTVLEFSWRDPERPMAKGAARVVYYLRVLQDDGNLAWSSPIWVDRP